MPVIENSSTFVLDNGAYWLKAGFSQQLSPRLVPNCITKARSEKRRAFVGDQIDDCRDLSSLFYMLPFQKGYLINWEHQKTIWDYLFSPACCGVEPGAKNIIFSEPYFNFSSIQEGINEVLFEEYRFRQVLRTTPADLSCYRNRLDHPEEPCCLVVDAGYSFTHVVPFIDGKRQKQAVRRLDVGGKLLTNHLKEITSYRQLHVLDETYVMNACREDCCFVSLNFEEDMKTASKRLSPSNPILQDYVLPDFTTLRRGFMRSPGQKATADNSSEQVIRMNNERFSVPELLFNPSDVGIHQMGIPELIVNAVEQCEEAAHRWLYRNIVLTGGCAATPNFRERVEREVRELAPAQFEVVVRLPGGDPATFAWRGGAALADDAVLPEISVSRAEYAEKGHAVCADRFYL